MTVLRLAAELTWGMLTGRYRPGDRVTRDFGWDECGRSFPKEVLHLDPLVRPRLPSPVPDPAGAGHPMYAPVLEPGIDPGRLCRLLNLD